MFDLPQEQLIQFYTAIIGLFCSHSSLSGLDQLACRPFKEPEHRNWQEAAVAQRVEPASCYRKVVGLIHLVCRLKCPRARY